MDKNYFINLTQKLYRLTFFFPEKEPLRYKIREMGDQILSNLVLILDGKIEERMNSSFDVEKNIEMLDALLDLAKTQLWVEQGEIEKVQDNYTLIKREVSEFNEILRKKMALKEERKLLTEKAERIEEEKKKYQRELQMQEQQGLDYQRKYHQVPNDTLKTKAQEQVAKMKQEQESLAEERKLQEEEVRKIKDEEQKPAPAKEKEALQEFDASKHYSQEEKQPEEQLEKETKKQPEVRSEEHRKSVLQAINSARATEKNGPEKEVSEKKEEDVKFNKRQRKILDLLEKRDQMQVKDFQEFLPTTKRTLRRDLLSLVESNVIKRTGRGNVTYYSKG